MNNKAQLAEFFAEELMETVLEYKTLHDILVHVIVKNVTPKLTPWEKIIKEHSPQTPDIESAASDDVYEAHGDRYLELSIKISNLTQAMEALPDIGVVEEILKIYEDNADCYEVR